MDSQNNSSTKLDVYEMGTTRIIQLLEAVPWKQPWTDAEVLMYLISKRPYCGRLYQYAYEEKL
jgi:antirestriction protein ArdC